VPASVAGNLRVTYAGKVVEGTGWTEADVSFAGVTGMGLLFTLLSSTSTILGSARGTVGGQQTFIPVAGADIINDPLPPSAFGQTSWRRL
jgi:hypothetical protein